ncbi:hypothetical protein Tcan_16691 [Toxocara canis]|uniref:Uncharacterized protein n=1 Tax=Toxocara canis TaxID=6265 RepID=A0A0B2VM46_TOXCA|nr:hypothetical protein Tcan_16691 [Toxocara canis]
MAPYFPSLLVFCLLRLNAAQFDYRYEQLQPFRWRKWHGGHELADTLFRAARSSAYPDRVNTDLSPPSLVAPRSGYGNQAIDSFINGLYASGHRFGYIPHFNEKKTASQLAPPEHFDMIGEATEFGMMRPFTPFRTGPNFGMQDTNNGLEKIAGTRNSDTAVRKSRWLPSFLIF